MTRHRVLFLIAAWCVAICLRQQVSGIPQLASASVEGIVVRAGAGSTVAGATVELTAIVGNQVRSFVTKTGTDGRFVLRNVPAGKGHHIVVIQYPDYIPAQYGQPAPGLPGSPLTLSGGEQKKDVRIELWPAASVSGRVLDNTGKPVKGMVRAHRPWHLETWRGFEETIRRSKFIAMVETNGQGEYKFEGLPAGPYYISAASNSSIRFGDPPKSGRLFAYYKGSNPGDDPAVVDLDWGQIVSGKDIVDRLVAWSRIAGQTVDAAGAPLRATQILVSRPGGVPFPEPANPQERFGSIVPAQADFEIPIHPGSYILTALAPGKSGRVVVKVGESGVTDLQIPMAPVVDIPGQFTLEGGSVDTLTVSLRSLTAAIPNIAARVSKDGAFSVRAVPAGDYRVDVLPVLNAPSDETVPPTLENVYVRSIRFGSEDVLNDSLRINAASSGRMDVVLSTNGGAVEGRVLRDKQEPVGYARVVLLPDGARGGFDKSAVSNGTGKFEIKGIPPGDYKLFAWEFVEPGAWQDAQFMRRYKDLGTVVRVSAGSTQTADTILIRAMN
jgi:hypothetical protein